jgi:DNA-binding transcriptional MerR regulator
MPAVASKRTAAGGFTERRYTPVDLLELMVLADLRRQGLSVGRIRLLLETLREKFGIRLFDAVGGAGTITLLTDGTEIYARMAGGEFVNVLRAPDQPLLVVGDGLPLRQLTARTKPQHRKKKTGKRGAKKKSGD